MATFPRTESAAIDAQVAVAAGSSTPTPASVVAASMSGTGEVGTSSLATGAVTAVKLGAKAATTAKIDDGAVTATQIAAGAGAAHFGAGGVTPDLLGMTITNKTGTTLVAGTLVYLSGWDTTTGNPSVSRADAKTSDAAATYVAIANIANNAAGVVAKRWLSTANLDTSAASAVGSLVYSDTSNGTIGGWIVASPAYRHDNVGIVVVKSASVGQIFFDLTGMRGTIIAGNQGDINSGTIGQAALANGAVSGTQATTVMATKTVSVAIGTISDTSNEETLIIAPFAGTLVAVKLLCKDALAASDSKYVTFAMTNKGQAAGGSTAMLSATSSGTTKATGGAAIAAYVARDLPLHATGANAVVAANDALVFTITETGTLVNTVTEGVLRLDFLVTT